MNGITAESNNGKYTINFTTDSKEEYDSVTKLCVSFMKKDDDVKKFEPEYDKEYFDKHHELSKTIFEIKMDLGKTLNGLKDLSIAIADDDFERRPESQQEKIYSLLTKGLSYKTSLESALVRYEEALAKLEEEKGNENRKG